MVIESEANMKVTLTFPYDKNRGNIELEMPMPPEARNNPWHLSTDAEDKIWSVNVVEYFVDVHAQSVRATVQLR